jgi:protein-disulfide isomerase
MNRVDHGRWVLAGILLCCASGGWLSGRLLIEHAGEFWHAPAAGVDWLGSLCDSAAAYGFDCEKNAQSAWSEFQIALPMPGGDLRIHRKIVTMPVAFIGLAYFVFLGTWFLFIGRPRAHGARWHRLPLLLVAGGTAGSILLLSLMALRIAPWCLTCVLAHGINLILLVLTWRLCTTQSAMRVVEPVNEQVTHWPRFVLARREVASVTTFALIMIAGLWMYRSEQLAFRRQYLKLLPYRNYVLGLQQDPEFLTREFLAQPVQDIPGAPAALPDDPPQLVVFTDFQCRSCACNWHQYKTQIAPAFDGGLRVTLKHFPLCAACNERATEDVHPEACRAAYAVEAARVQGGDQAAWKLHDLLFQNQKNLNERTYRTLAARLGLDPDALWRDMQSDAVRQVVADDVALAKRLNVTAAPTMFLNGRQVPSLCRTPVFWKAIVARLQSQRDAAHNGGGECDERNVVSALTQAREVTP